MIVSTVTGIVSAQAHGQTSPSQQQSAPYTTQFPQPNTNPFPNQQQPQPPQQQPQPQQQYQYPPQLQQQFTGQHPQPQQQYQYPPQLQQQFTGQQPQQQQVPNEQGVLMNESKVVNCLHSVLNSSIDKALKHAAGLNEATFINNATSTLDSCILPRR
jgi:hypothetical protein